MLRKLILTLTLVGTLLILRLTLVGTLTSSIYPAEEVYLECVKSLDMKSINEYISNNNEGSYQEEKDRAQKVLDQLWLMLEGCFEATIKNYTLAYERMVDESSDEYHPVKGERLPLVLKSLRNSHKHWKEYIRNEHTILYEENIGGTGSYYWANLWEIEQLVNKITYNCGRRPIP
jgi:hypothetical protein